MLIGVGGGGGMGIDKRGGGGECHREGLQILYFQKLSFKFVPSLPQGVPQ